MAVGAAAFRGMQGTGRSAGGLRAIALHAIALLGASLASSVLAEAVLSEPPAVIDVKARYLFYLHGKIVEDKGRMPTHPSFGTYEYDALLAALGVQGARVISEQRSAGAKVHKHAAKVAAQVERLIAAGVPQAQVAVVGFSKGGQIAQEVSARLKYAEVRYVLLASCPEGREGPARLHGKVLSILESTDEVPSCSTLFERSRSSAETRELVVTMGGAHGAFYRPRPLWLKPLLEFVK